MSTRKFSAQRVNRLRTLGAAAGAVDRDVADGWSKSPVDPMNLLRVFDALRIRKGFVLRAYQFYSGGNGNGFVWAMPETVPFPDPNDCPKLEGRFLEPPMPP